ncbi:DUF3892 domain-containing protein [Paraburkholderia pallida]|uniref:DUF3892 domain-containing protein n=1 Tax=Paraburkholderia pallida TaxID=2547399 RepID=A0A4P7D4N6_9BURK|nr:DUF3892 domain-containing protein [Paraburkholderia pallida]QBR03761.1 DUF3892 domain-containing protein [Paraburkholderia pallida]
MKKFDYYVSAVEYNKDKTHITKLRIHSVGQDGSVGASQEATRPQVIELIKKGKTFSSIVKNAEGKWAYGSKLEVIEVTTEFLKTKQDNSLRDNLENLPQF